MQQAAVKLALALTLVTAATLAGAALPAKAESSYWENRWRSSDHAPEYRRLETERVVKRRHADRRTAPRRRYVERDSRYADAFPNPFRVERPDGLAHPTMNNDYWLQQSIYDFQDGKAADIKQYRY